MKMLKVGAVLMMALSVAEPVSVQALPKDGSGGGCMACKSVFTGDSFCVGWGTVDGANLVGRRRCEQETTIVFGTLIQQCNLYGDLCTGGVGFPSFRADI